MSSRPRGEEGCTCNLPLP